MGLSLTYLILTDLGLRDHGSKRIPNIRDYLAYNNHRNLPAVLCSLYDLVCGVGGTVPGEYWGLGGHVGRASVVWLGWRVRLHWGG